MSQITGTSASVTNGSAIVTDSSATFITDLAAAGHGFTVVGSGVPYTIASVDSETQITLSTTYAGTTATNVSYAIYTDFTSPDNIPELNKGDIETATIFTRAMRVIQGLFTQFKNLIASTTTHNFTSDGDYTLTSTQEGYGRIVLTDTTPVLTTSRNVIVSTELRGRWYVNNTLQILTVKTSAGTGKALQVGESRYLVCDGTNVVEGETRLDLTTLGTVEAKKAIVTDASKNVTGVNELYVTSKLGVGTTDVPHASVGTAMLAIDGANSSTTLGPHVQITTDADNYPLFQMYNNTHDSIAMIFDGYIDTSSINRSSDAGSNFLIVKTGDQLVLQYDSGVAQGATITWNTGFSLAAADGTVTVPGAFVVGSPTGSSGNGAGTVNATGVFVNNNPVPYTVSAPASSSSTGTAGQIAYDSTYLYVCYATNSWGRIAMTTTF